MTGLENLLINRRKLLSGQKIGLLAHQASVDRRLNHTVDLIGKSSPGKLKVLFGPEHGFFGTAQDMESVEHAVDPRTGLSLISLYGKGRRTLMPMKAELSRISLLMIDLQDIGARYYTYCQSMVLAMAAAGEAGIPVLVLDRPNPLNGRDIEGPPLKAAFESFVGLRGLAVRHGMTIGEIACMANHEFGIHCRLEVVPMKGWRRSMAFEETGLPWVQPSPNMPTMDTARIYPGGCLWEGTNLSEGRGTTRPFEIVGAPYLDPFKFSEALNRLSLPGVRFRPLFFTPQFQKWAGRVCGGVQLHVVNQARFKPFLTGVAVLFTARRQGGSAFAWRKQPYEFEKKRPAIDLLYGDDRLRKMLEKNRSLKTLRGHLASGLPRFRAKRKKYLLY
jgi:uncharacterized protein YbbC (DUF1343 family)